MAQSDHQCALIIVFLPARLKITGLVPELSCPLTAETLEQAILERVAGDRELDDNRIEFRDERQGFREYGPPARRPRFQGNG
jgi:hypothetical protein